MDGFYDAGRRERIRDDVIEVVPHRNRWAFFVRLHAVWLGSEAGSVPILKCWPVEVDKNKEHSVVQLELQRIQKGKS